MQVYVIVGKCNISNSIMSIHKYKPVALDFKKKYEDISNKEYPNKYTYDVEEYEVIE